MARSALLLTVLVASPWIAEGGQAETGWLTSDQLRPPSISTHDFRFDLNRLLLFLDTGGDPANREQIERVVYRAFTTLMPPRASSCQAHDTIVQAAHELYGEQSPAEQALREAFTAVGIVSCQP